MNIIKVDTNEKKKEKVRKLLLELGILKKSASTYNREYIQSAVLIPLYLKENDLHVLLTERTKSISIYAGEVCLPGGRCDGNEDSIQTALRESREEIDLREENVDIVGILNPLLATRNSKFYQVHGVVGIIKQSFSTDMNTDEVGLIFSMPLKNFVTKTKYSNKHKSFCVKHARGESPSDGVFLVCGMTFFMLYFFACDYYNIVPSQKVFEAIPNFNDSWKSYLSSKL